MISVIIVEVNTVAEQKQKQLATICFVTCKFPLRSTALPAPCPISAPASLCTAFIKSE